MNKNTCINRNLEMEAQVILLIRKKNLRKKYLDINLVLVSIVVSYKN